MRETDITPEEFQEILEGCNNIFQSSAKDITEKFRRDAAEARVKITQKIKLPPDPIRS